MSALVKKCMPRIACVALSLAGAIVIVSCSVSAPTITAPRYALVYGIIDYPGTINDLQYSVNDADSMKGLFSQQGWKVSESINSQVTKAQIIIDFASLSKISSDSTVLLYYSGHGTTVGTTAYLVTYDSLIPYYVGTSDETSSFDSTNAISPGDLSAFLAMLPTKNVIVILDSCYSGAFASSSAATDSSPSDYSSMASYSAFSTAMSHFGSLLVANASASGGKTPIVLSGAGSQEKDYESGTLGHGIFTYYLLQAATLGDADGDGVVTTTEAYAYAAAAIKSQWDSNPFISAFLPHISGDTRDLVLFTD
jgi:hypothetical protein